MENLYEGISHSGNIQEALNDAIAKAKLAIPTEYITWELEKLSGEDGGWAQTHIITLKIKAQVPS